MDTSTWWENVTLNELDISDQMYNQTVRQQPSNHSSQNVSDTGYCPLQHQIPEIFLHGTVAVAFFIILGFSFLEKRTQKCLNCCKQKPGLVVPINLLDDFDNRWGYAFAFGAITNTIVVIFQDGPVPSIEGRIVAKVLLGLLTFVEVCVNLYPFFACLNTSHKIIGNIIGFLYAGMWFGVLMYFTLECLDPFPDVLPFFGLVIEFPTLLCLAFLVVCYSVSLGLTLRDRHRNKNKVQVTSPVLACKWQEDYVRHLLKKQDECCSDDEKLTLCEKMKKWVSENLYEYKVPFRFSSRVFCSIFVVFMCTYQLGVAYFWWNGKIIDWLNLEIDHVLGVINLPANTSSVNNVEVASRILNIGWSTVTALTLVLFVLDVLVVFVSYRSHMLKLFRGDRSFLPNDMNTESAELMRCCMLYCGFQIGYMIWGFFVMTFVMWLLVLIAGFIIVLPAMNGYYDILISVAEVMVIPVVVDFGLRYLQQILARVVFLQPKVNKDDDQRPLALNNRKLFHITNYFFFFSNIATGLFSCLLRILKTLAFGLIYLGRLDVCVLMGGRESFDIGHNAYLGMIHIEAAHNNPILRTFCQILCNQPENAKTDTTSEPIEDDPSEVKVDDMQERISLALYPEDGDAPAVIPQTWSRRARRRWHLLYTLLHNPHLIPQRRFDIACKIREAERKIDINVVIAKKQRYDKLKQELDDLEREIIGDNEAIAEQNKKSTAFTICNNLVKMDVSVDPSYRTKAAGESNGAVKTSSSVDPEVLTESCVKDSVSEGKELLEDRQDHSGLNEKDMQDNPSFTDTNEVEDNIGNIMDGNDESSKLEVKNSTEKCNLQSSTSSDSVNRDADMSESSPSQSAAITVVPSSVTSSNRTVTENLESVPGDHVEVTKMSEPAGQLPSVEVTDRSDKALSISTESEKL